jgi:CheY-like chemotaxis protein
MISALQKAYPRLAALLTSRGSDLPGTEQKTGPEAVPETKTGTSWTSTPGIVAQRPAAEQEGQRALKQFFEVAPERVTEIRSLFTQVSAAPVAQRPKVLGDLATQVRVLRSICEGPGLESVSKVAAAFDRLLRKFAEQPSCLTPSTLRTSGSTIILLEALCKPGLQGDLISNPAPRFLSIDDDPVCRRAISFALEQTISPPDHAEDGQGALELVEKQFYDIIFLDVEMPGMNGFEVCTRIHQTKRNSHTPVVFVTVHSDFDSRAKASESSGHDLIAKPFLPCELTLKALTVLLRRRMQSGVPSGVAASAPAR